MNVVKVVRAEVSSQPLDVAEHAALVADAAAGAVVTFAGVVRDHDHGREVVELEYSAHPTAARVLAETAAAVAERFTGAGGAAPGVRAIAVSHRIGTLTIGDVALACVVAADHRAEAFAACAQLVDELKRVLPIWKRQSFADGHSEWVNSP
jgi:molybdopterin synthase catalytic subunit